MSKLSRKGFIEKLPREVTHGMHTKKKINLYEILASVIDYFVPCFFKYILFYFIIINHHHHI